MSKMRNKLGTLGYKGTGVAIIRAGGSKRVMLHKLSNVLLTGVIGLALSCGIALAQASDDQSGKQQGSANRSTKMGQSMSVTGCLQKDTAKQNEYTIRGEDGTTWALKDSSTAKLGDHVNHKVTVTGKVTKEGHETQPGDLSVSDVKMISQSCQ
jgi:hypothetical protein